MEKNRDPFGGVVHEKREKHMISCKKKILFNQEGIQ